MRLLFIIVSTFMALMLGLLGWKHDLFPDLIYRRWMFYAMAVWYVLFMLACIFLWGKL